MKWRFRRKQVRSDIEHARRERIASERRLEETQREVIIPLHDLREKNHVKELLDALISRRQHRETGG